MKNTVISVNKIIYAQLYWVNQHNNLMRSSAPKQPTVNGESFPALESATPYSLEYPKETLLERAKRLDLLDKFKPVVYLRMQGGVKLRIEGERGKKIFEEFKGREFRRNVTRKPQQTKSTKKKNKAYGDTTEFDFVNTKGDSEQSKSV